jgi:[NiFe] hydrogenase large subunit
MVHYLSSVRAVENAVGVQIPDNARIIRNLMMGSQFQHDHIVHFYHLHALDWVDVVSALKADPKKTAALSDSVSNAPWGGANYFKGVQQRIKTFVDSGQLGPFNNAYWGHPAYKLPPEANLMATAHYIEALRLQAKAARMHAVFGAKNPHLQSFVVGGVTCVRDLTPDRIAEYLYLWKETQDFIKNVYIPDLVAVASFYKDWGAIGGTTNFLAWGEFPLSDKEPDSLFMPRGLIVNRDLKGVKMPVQEKVAEDVTHGWYEEGGAKHPYDGETKPKHGDYNTEKNYTWFKAPRYEAHSCEVGPLARVLVAYARGHEGIKGAVDGVAKQLGIPITALFSTLGRTAARGIETLVVGQAIEGWVMEMVGNLKNGNAKTYESWTMPKSGMGVGLNDVPRGSLGHWIRIEDGKIGNYQYVVPSTWNLGPRCANGKLGPVEEALIGTPVADPKRPVEVLRTVHSFDPCIACGVHVIDPDSNQVYKVKAV